jgi:hypothetical protein
MFLDFDGDFRLKQSPFPDIVPTSPAQHLKLNHVMHLDKAEQITTVAKQRIIHQPHLSVQRIWCDFDGKRLILRGQVPSFYFKQLAQEAVADLEGVEQVVNEIEVLW